MTSPQPKPAHRERAAPKAIPRRVNVRRIGAGTHSQKVRKANLLWRDLIRAKEPYGLCPRCLLRPWHDAAHFFTKGAYPAMRFELDNGAPICRACHRRIDSDHEAKLEFAQRYLGPERYEALRLRAIGRGKCDVDLTIMYLMQRSVGQGPGCSMVTLVLPAVTEVRR